jgi:tetratricopeptide (TPR) repeat protein
MKPKAKLSGIQITVDDLIKLGVSHIDERDYARAEEFLRQANKLAPTNSDAIDYLAVALTGQNKLEEGLRLHEEAVRLSEETNFRYLLNLGSCYFASDRQGDAEKTLSKAHALDTENFDILLKLGTLYFEANVPALAEELLKKALKQKPRHGEILVTLAAIEETKGNFANEIQYLRKFVDSKPRQEHLDEINLMIEKMLRVIDEKVEHTIDVGTTYLQAGRYKEAESLYRKALRRLGQNSGLLNDLGVALHNQKRYLEAIKCFRQAIKLNSKPLYWCNLADNLHLNGDTGAAIEAFSHVTRLHDDYVLAHWQSGRMFIEIRDYERAEQALKRAIEIDECHADANFQLSFVEQYKGNVTAALEALERALSNAQSPGFIQSVRNRMQELQAIPSSANERNLWSIAERLCGNASLATALHKLNRERFVWISQDGSIGYYGLKDGFDESDLQLPQDADDAKPFKAGITCAHVVSNFTTADEAFAKN